MNKIPVSVLIQTKNEEKGIASCLAHLREFDEVFVVDSNSTDRTAELAKEAGATVINFTWDGKFPQKKQWMLTHVDTRNEWLLIMDADEFPTPELAAELRSIAEDAAEVRVAFDVPMAYYFAGAALKHGHRVVKRTFLRRGMNSYRNIDLLDFPGMGELEAHYQPEALGPVGRTTGKLVHNDMDPVRTWFDRHNLYSDWEASIRIHPETRGSVRESKSSQGRRFDAVPLKPLVFFLYSYMLRRGFLDGRAGFDYALGLSMYYWQIGLKSRELQREQRRTTDNTAAAQHGGLNILQVGGLAGPGAVAGGVWAVARTQSAALAGLGENVELVGGWLGSGPEAADTADGRASVRLFRVRRPFPGARLRGLVSLRLPRYVAARAASADVVQVHLCRDFITSAATVLLGRGNTPVIAQSHGMLAPSRSLLIRIYDTVITRRLVRIPRLWLTLTEEEERGLQQLGVDPVRMRRVVNATVASENMWSDPEQQVFLFAARLAPRKQPAVFVQAALEALDRGLDARFVLAGPDQGEAARVRALIAASAHADRFELSGELSPAQVQSAMAACTAYVLPALKEPYPMSVIEAAAVGTPLIVTAECGLAADLYEGDAAVLPEPTADAFCEAMLNLAANPHRRVELGANARRLHQRLWSAQQLAEDLRKLCFEALEEMAGSGAATTKPAEPVQQN